MKFEYSDKPVTPWGGLLQMKQLLDKSGIGEQLKRIGLPESQSNNRIHSWEIVEALFVSVWIGASRFSHTAVVRVDETIKEIFGWKRVASAATYSRFFKKFSWATNTHVFTEINAWFFQQLKFDNYTLDVDSSVLTRHGQQEGSLRGYNPSKRGRPSHHPLFAFLSDVRMVANCWLRSGNTASSTNCVAFLRETFTILKGKTIGLFRADSGFCTEKIFSFLEERQTPIAYVIAGRWHGPLQLQMRDIHTWHVVDKGIWITESTYRAKEWSRSRRIVILRQSVGLRPKAGGKTLKLFDDTQLYKNYRYHCFFTNQSLPAKEIWEQYKRRGDAENRIQELKQDFGMNGFCLNQFFATEAALRMVMIAYNVMSLYRQFSGQTHVHQRLSTLRFHCFAVGSWIVTKGRQRVLKMSVPLKRRQWFDGLFAEIQRNQLPLSLKT